ETLDALWDAGLLESSGPERYTLHRTIADYAQTHTQDLAAQQRLVSYMLPYIQIHQRDYEAIEQEASNILAALDASVLLGMLHELIEGVITLVPFMRVRGRYAQAEYYLRKALQATMELEDEER